MYGTACAKSANSEYTVQPLATQTILSLRDCSACESFEVIPQDFTKWFHRTLWLTCPKPADSAPKNPKGSGPQKDVWLSTHWGKANIFSKKENFTKKTPKQSKLSVGIGANT